VLRSEIKDTYSELQALKSDMEHYLGKNDLGKGGHSQLDDGVQLGQQGSRDQAQNDQNDQSNQDADLAEDVSTGPKSFGTLVTRFEKCRSDLARLEKEVNEDLITPPSATMDKDVTMEETGYLNQRDLTLD